MQVFTLMVGMLAILAVGALYALANQTVMQPTSQPISSVSNDALVQSMAINRIFQDEMRATKTLDLGNTAAPFPWPERLQDMRPSPAAVASPREVATTNRIFQDEINAAAVSELGVTASYPWPERLQDVRGVLPVATIGIQSRPVTSNRLFQDEVNAARVLDLGDPQSPFFTWPERLGEQPVAMVIAATTPVAQPRSVVTNRFFLDEIAGAGTRNESTAIPTAGEVTHQRGPR